MKGKKAKPVQRSNTKVVRFNKALQKLIQDHGFTIVGIPFITPNGTIQVKLEIVPIEKRK